LVKLNNRFCELSDDEEIKVNVFIYKKRILYEKLVQIIEEFKDKE